MAAAKKRLEPIRALKLFGELYNDKENTRIVFEIIEALSTGREKRGYNHLRKTASGLRMLKTMPNLIETLSDFDYLSTLPQGTLGRGYYEFMSEENLTADGLVEASEIDRQREIDSTPQEEWYGLRIRDAHDLWHVSTGYGRDAVGEMALLAFSYAQTDTLGIGFISAMAAIAMQAEDRNLPAIRAAIEGYQLGRKARWLPGVEWENMLELPIADVREKLRIGKPKVYHEILRAYGPAFEAEAENARLAAAA